METLWENKSRIINELINTLAKDFSRRTDEPEKCRRDLEYIYDAIINDYLEDSDHYVTIIANKFWYMGVRQIETFHVEFAIYDLLEKKLIELGTNQERISKKISLLKKIIEFGPTETQTESLNSAAWSARRCQRNWDYSVPVNKKDIITLANIATTMPAKQARTYFELLISTDKNLNDEIRKHSIDMQGNFHPSWQNTQVSAPVLFIYITTDNTNNELKSRKAIKSGNEFREDGIYAIGISSGAVALAANYMGYKTGFCRCFDGPTIQSILENRLGVQFHKMHLMLGIGNPNSKILYNQCYDNEGNLQEILGNPRDCKYHII